MITNRDPTDVVAPAWAIRPELPIDLDQIHELHRAAFRGREEAELVDAIRGGPDFVPELSLVAVTNDGSVLGHVLLSHIGFEPDDGSPRQQVLALAPLAVLPPHWSRGIGSALVTAALAAADARDEALVLVLGSPAYYARFGFAPALRRGISGPYEAAGEAFQVRPRAGVGDLAPGRAVYPPMFSNV